MKNVFNIISIISLVAVIILFLLFFKTKTQTQTINETKIVDTAGVSQKVAYINTDTLMLKYEYYTVLKDSIVGIQKKHEADLQRRSSQFEKEVAEFQRKVKTNSFLSQESAAQQEQEMYRKQQELMELKDQMSMNLANQEQAMQLRLYDTVVNFLKVYNADNKYKYILNNTSYGGAILYANPVDNITDTIASLLNERYKKSKAK
jgi:outer membrane protein